MRSFFARFGGSEHRTNGEASGAAAPHWLCATQRGADCMVCSRDGVVSEVTLPCAASRGI